MRNAIILFLCLFFMSCAAASVKTNDEQTFGWDLSYKSLLEKNNIGHDEWLSKWCKSRKNIPVKEILSKWDKEPITSSILFEQPAFHAGEQVVTWFIGTSKGAYYFVFLRDEIKTNCKPINYNSYNSVLKEVSSWEQAPPFVSRHIPGEQLPPSGYFAFLSVYCDSKTKQILLSLDDFYNFDNIKDEKLMWGRIKVFHQILDTF